METVQMAGKPYQSCLIPHEKEIITMRRRRPPMPYSQIATLLHEKYQLTIGSVGIRDFVRRRAVRASKTCRYAWDIRLSEEDNQPKPSSPQTAKPAITDMPKSSVTSQPKDFDMPFSENYNLHILSPEAAANLQKQLEEEENQ